MTEENNHNDLIKNANHLRKILNFIGSDKNIMFDNTIKQIMNETRIGRYLLNGFNSNVERIYVYPDILKQTGVIGYFSPDDKNMALDFTMCKLAACQNFIECVNFTDTEKEIIYNKIKRTGLSKNDNIEDIALELKKAKKDLNTVLIHETTHAKDFAKIDVYELDEKSHYLFKMISEINAYKAESFSVLEKYKSSFPDLLTTIPMQTIEYLALYYGRNKLKIGEPIPNNHMKTINAILINSFFTTKVENPSKTRHDFYQTAILNFIEKSDEPRKSMSFNEIRKKIGLNATKEDLNYIYAKIMTPSSHINALKFKELGIVMDEDVNNNINQKKITLKQKIESVLINQKN